MHIRVRKSQLQGVGLSPGEFAEPKEKSGAHPPPRLKVIGYGPDGCFELDTNKLNVALARIGEKAVTWIQVIGISEVSFIKELGEQMKIHPLALEAVATTWGRSKLQDYGDQLFVVGKSAMVEPGDPPCLAIEQVSIVMGRNYLVTFQETESTLFEPVEKRIMDPQRLIRQRNTGYLLYALLDTLVDHLLASIDALEEDIIRLEDGVLEGNAQLDLQNIYRHKRAVIMLSRIAAPMQELARRCETLDCHLLPDTLDYYYRDLADHATRAAERIEHGRVVLQNLQEYYHMEGDHRNNDVMRVLTVVATIFIPMTFVVGVYGMNFNTASKWNLPELNWPYGYPLVMGLMGLYAVVTFCFFRKKGWI